MGVRKDCFKESQQRAIHLSAVSKCCFRCETGGCGKNAVQSHSFKALQSKPWYTAFQTKRRRLSMAESTDAPTTPSEAITPVGINHLVLNVRNLEESHTFWTEIMGFKQVGELHPRPDVQRPKM